MPNVINDFIFNVIAKSERNGNKKDQILYCNTFFIINNIHDYSI